MKYKLTEIGFWTIWIVLLLLVIGCCLTMNWNLDMALLGAAYALSMLSTLLCHRIKPEVAFGNLIIMTIYNAVLTYNLIFNSQYGSGFTWYFLALLLNSIHSITLLIYMIPVIISHHLHKQSS